MCLFRINGEKVSWVLTALKSSRKFRKYLSGASFTSSTQQRKQPTKTNKQQHHDGWPDDFPRRLSQPIQSIDHHHGAQRAYFSLAKGWIAPCCATKTLIHPSIIAGQSRLGMLRGGRVVTASGSVRCHIWQRSRKFGCSTSTLQQAQLKQHARRSKGRHESQCAH